MGTLEAIIRNEPCQPSDIITLKVQWSFRCWWASGSWTTAGERDLDDRSRTRKFPGGEGNNSTDCLTEIFTDVFFFRWWWYNFADFSVGSKFVCHVRFLCSMKGWEIGGNTRHTKQSSVSIVELSDILVLKQPQDSLELVNAACHKLRIVSAGFWKGFWQCCRHKSLLN